MNRNRKQRNHIKVAHIVTIIFLLTAGALLYYLFTTILKNIALGENNGQATRFEFTIDNPSGIGFNRDITVYTEHGITKVTFSGTITIDGTADIIVMSNDNGSILFSEHYSKLKTKAVSFEVDNLEPYTYYTLRFSSNDATKGYLLLTTNKSLVERPKQPERLPHTPPRQN